jgi:membrane protease YdiL (CAAX protease family)
MNNKALFAYFLILLSLCAGFIVGARLLGESGAYLAQGYMLTPALAAIFTRLLFYPARFKDANLRFGALKDYFKFWAFALGISALSFVLYTLFGAIEWDLSGSSFLTRLEEQFALSGEDMLSSIPPGFTPKLMLALFTLGGLTIFNIIPGMINGFGEEFGHRGLMFPQLYRIKPWIGLIGGGLIWYLWHQPLAIIIPAKSEMTFSESLLTHITLATGSVCTSIYLAYVYVKSRSIFVTSLAHIAMNNAAAALSYYVIVQDQLLANLGTTLTMIIVVGVLYFTGKLRIFKQLGAMQVDENVPRMSPLEESSPRP